MSKIFAVKFTIEGNKIQTEMRNQDVNKQEALGLLEMAKKQILDELSSGRKEVFKKEVKKDE